MLQIEFSSLGYILCLSVSDNFGAFIYTIFGVSCISILRWFVFFCLIFFGLFLGLAAYISRELHSY